MNIRWSASRGSEVLLAAEGTTPAHSVTRSNDDDGERSSMQPRACITTDLSVVEVLPVRRWSCVVAELRGWHCDDRIDRRALLAGETLHPAMTGEEGETRCVHDGPSSRCAWRVIARRTTSDGEVRRSSSPDESFATVALSFTRWDLQRNADSLRTMVDDGWRAISSRSSDSRPR